MTQRGIPKKIKDACKEYLLARHLPIGQYGILLNLALRSYKNLPLEERKNWTLEEIVKQGL